MKDKHTINLILISSKWVIPSFEVCSWWINSSSKCFHLFFSWVQISSAMSSKPPSKSPQGSSYSFILHSISSSFCHQSSSWWFFMIYFIPQEFIKILIKGAQVSLLLASRSVINSLYSFEVEFCISSFFSAIQSFPFVAGCHLMILRCYL